MQNEIFGISLNEKGIRQVIQVYKKVKLVFIGSIIWSVINLVSILVRLTMLREVFRYGRNTSQLMVVYSYWVFTIILLPLQGYYYYAFSKEMKLSIEEQNTEKFNDSFRLLGINATLVLLTLAANLLNVLYTLSSPLFR